MRSREPRPRHRLSRRVLWAGLGAAAAIALAVVLLLSLGTEAGSAGPPDPVTVSPAPRDRWASPQTQISLRGLPAGRLGTLRVSGSRSGSHTGTLKPHSDGEGASWVPDEAFDPGEKVHVETDLTIPGADHGDYDFWTSRPAAPPPPRTADQPGGAVQRFRSLPGLSIPAVSILKRTPEATPGYTFLAPKRGSGDDGPMIVDDRGQVVWTHPVGADRQATDFRPQTLRGKPVLTWWEGVSTVGVGFGEGVVLDDHYKELMRVHTGNGYKADLHEFLITPRGTALMLSYAYVHRDLTAVGGPKEGLAIDGIVQEVDLQTGLVEFEWHTMDHIPLDESHWPLPPDATKDAYDFAHLNSISIDADGDLLVSSRHTWTIYKVDRRTGSIRWRLGGKRSDFELAPDAAFAYQHDAARRADGAITLFDNAASVSPQPGKHSRALALRLDEEHHTAAVAEQYPHPAGLLSETQGDYQTLPNGHVFVGWGAQPAFSEFTPDGKLVLDGRIANGNDNYRAYHGPWSGQPDTRPAVRVAGKRAYVSWNGATNVARWQLLAGAPGALRPAGEAAPTAFETALPVPAGAKRVAVRALGPRGGTLSESAPVSGR